MIHNSLITTNILLLGHGLGHESNINKDYLETKSTYTFELTFPYFLMRKYSLYFYLAIVHAFNVSMLKVLFLNT